MNNLSPALQTIHNLKALVKNTRIKVMLKVNSEAIAMYFEMGKELAHNNDSNDGSKNIDREAELNSQLQQLAAVLSWGHICIIFDEIKAVIALISLPIHFRVWDFRQ